MSSVDAIICLIVSHVRLGEHHRKMETTNEFFRSNLHHNNEILAIDSEINVMQSTIYNYFSDHQGVINDENRNNFKTDYNVISKNELQRKLKVLKSRIPKPEEEIKCFSRILRKKFSKKRSGSITKLLGNTAKKF